MGMSNRASCLESNNQTHCAYLPNHDFTWCFGGQISSCEVVNHKFVEPIDSDADLDATTKPMSRRPWALDQEEC